MDLNRQALAAAQEIARYLQDVDPSTLGPSLAGGHAGIALFFGHLHARVPDPRYAARTIDHLARAFDDAAARPGIGLFSGSTGVAWVAQHLARGLAEVDVQALSAFDDELHAAVASMPEPWTAEWIGGIAGVGLYALARLPSPAARDLAEHLVGRLEASRIDQLGGCTWYIPPPGPDPERGGRTPEDFRDLGLSHGIAGVIAFLAAALRAGIAPQRTAALLAGAMDWLVIQDGGGGHGARFANWAASDGPASSSPVAWCYGDLGIAVAVLQAARAAGRPDWEGFGLGLALHAASHRGDAARVADNGLCHGTSGNAHLFHRLNRRHGLPAFAAAAAYWYGRTLAERRPAPGSSGYRAHVRRNGVPTRIEEPGLLLGAAGIGLALLSLQEGAATGWDALLGCGADA